MPQISDEVLVRRAQTGDRPAFEELIGRYEHKTYNLALRMLGNHADAADAAQEALVRVYTRLCGFRGEAAFSTWMLRVVTTTCLDELRRRKRLRSVPVDEPLLLGDSSGLGCLIAPTAGLELAAERREVREAVERALDRLPEGYRLVIVLRDLRDYSYEQMAGCLGCTLGTIKSRLHRARKALRLAVLTTNVDAGELIAG